LIWMAEAMAFFYGDIKELNCYKKTWDQENS
jgi:hypothetical protein